MTGAGRVWPPTDYERADVVRLLRLRDQVEAAAALRHLDGADVYVIVAPADWCPGAASAFGMPVRRVEGVDHAMLALDPPRGRASHAEKLRQGLELADEMAAAHGPVTDAERAELARSWPRDEEPR